MPRRTAAARSPRSRPAIATRPESARSRSATMRCSAIMSKSRPRHADRLMAPDSGFTHRQTLAGVVRFNSPELHEEASRVVEAGAHALAAEAAHAEELTALAVAAAPQITATAEAIARIDVAASHAHRAAEGGWALPQLTDEPCLEIEAGRHPVVEAALQRQRRALRRQRSLARPERPAVADHRPQHGRQVDLPSPDGADRRARPGRQLRPRRPRQDRDRRPPVQPRRRVGQSRARPLDLHGRDGRDRRDPRAGDAAEPRHPRRDRARHLDLRRARDRLGGGRGDARPGEVPDLVRDPLSRADAARRAARLRCRCTTSARANGRAISSCSTKSPTAPPTAATASPSPSSPGLPPAVVARARSVLAKLEAGRDATGGIAAGLDDLPLFAASGRARACARSARCRRSTRSIPTA